MTQAWLDVVEAGPRTTVQDVGRPGWGHLGVPPSGALDRGSFALANRLVGNAPTDAALEATLCGPAVRLAAREPRRVAVTGAPAPVTVDGAGRPLWAPFDLRPGQTLRVGGAVGGARTYLAFGGGIAVDAVLGSRSTDLLSGLGPPPLAAGMRLDLGADTRWRPLVDVAPAAALPAEPVLAVTPGPRADWFVPGAFDLLLTAVWTVLPASNRVGVRLDGPRLSRSRAGELPPEGLVTGSVQIPAAGTPLVFMNDHPVTGGYPALAVVVDADLDLVAQLAPGAPVRFAAAMSEAATAVWQG